MDHKKAENRVINFCMVAGVLCLIGIFTLSPVAGLLAMALGLCVMIAVALTFRDEQRKVINLRGRLNRSADRCAELTRERDKYKEERDACLNDSHV